MDNPGKYETLEAANTRIQKLEEELQEAREVLTGPKKKPLTEDQRNRLADVAGNIRRRLAEDPESAKRVLDAIMAVCPSCGGEDDDHSEGCLVAELQAKVKSLEVQVHQSSQRILPDGPTAEGILREYVELRERGERDTPADNEAAMGTGEFEGAPPCICPPCHTYRAAKELFKT